MNTTLMGFISILLGIDNPASSCACGSSVTFFCILPDDHVIMKKIVSFAFIADFREKWAYGPEPCSVHNKKDTTRYTVSMHSLAVQCHLCR